VDLVDIQLLHDALRDVPEPGRAPLLHGIATDVQAGQRQDSARDRHLGHHVERPTRGLHLDGEDRVIAVGVIDDDPDFASH
jgi:hypothetical protein